MAKRDIYSQTYGYKYYGLKERKVYFKISFHSYQTMY